MTHGVTHLYHATQRVPDLDAVQRFFADVFGRDSVILGDYLPRTDGVDYGIPRDYARFTPIAEVLVESVDPVRVRDGGEPVAEPRLSGLAWFVDGIEEVWGEMRRHGMRGSGMDHVVLDGDELPRTVSDTPFILTVPDETGLSYELLTFRPNRDPRGNPPVHAVLDADPLGIECCAYHTVVTAQPERPLELLTEVLGGRVVHEDRNDVHGSQSTFVTLGDGVVEIAVPLVDDSRAMERLREESPDDSYYGLTWKVRDLEAVARHLTGVGVHHDWSTATTIVTHPPDSLGVPWGFTTATVPGDTRFG